MPGLTRLGQNLGVGFMHLMTCGISWVVKRGGMSHCPQCKHLQSRHQRRADGSFMD
ncbi:hypothetical protein ABZ876_08355 [Streptomyces sp. NPDC046931]|uniref:hypothetical protein n=1 Tax=Streptomyces sp. NPDC046931 TaxID=3154806 RepID=UPI0033E769FA